MEFIKKIIYWYQRQMFYFNSAVGEARKPLQFINETLLVLTFLAVRGVKVSIGQTILVYLIVFVVFVFLGKLLIWLGVLKYIARIGNKQNPEIMEILERVKKIEEKISV